MIIMGFNPSSISYAVISIFVYVSPCFYVKAQTDWTAILSFSTNANTQSPVSISVC